MNITKLNKKRIITNVIIFNIILFFIFIGGAYLFYQKTFNKSLTFIKDQQKKEAAAIKHVVRKYFNQANMLKKRISLYESRKPFKIYIIDNKTNLIYPGSSTDILNNLLKNENGYFYHNNSLFYSQKVIVKGKEKDDIEIRIVISRGYLGQMKVDAFKKIIYKGIALYLVVAYILSMLILIISRLNYDKFQTRIFGDLIKHTNDGFIITDDEGNIIFANDSFLKIFNISLKKLLGKNISKFNSNIHDTEFFKSMWGQLDREGSWEGEIINSLDDGTKIFTKLKVTAIINKNTKVKYYIGVYEDKTDSRMQKIDILKLQLYDSFTGLPNRTYGKKYLEKLVGSKTDFAYMNICIDNFKDINEVYGFEIANKVLLQYIEKIKEIFNHETFIARVDGKKICLVLDAFNMVDLGNKLQAISDISKTPFKIFSENILVASNGCLIFYPEDKLNIEEMLDGECKKIDNLLKADSIEKITNVIKEKEAGKDKVIDLMKTAVKNKEFSLFYQPRIDSNNNKLVGAEALIRWNNSELGNVSPMYFIPLAEKCGYIDKITDWTIAELCSQLEAWKKELKIVVPTSINISPISMKNKNFVNKFTSEFKKYRLDHNDIQIEITEKAINNDCSNIKEYINELNEQGFKVFVDNFGTGNSKLNYLKKLHVNALKIDREFIKNYPDKDDGSIAKVIINMADSLHLQVVGEGAENIEQVSFLRANGCHLIQGYHFSKPLQIEEFKKVLAEQKV
jgi:PAS domain S-box-containing protein/diguanylate cyclase (GGDEF)-like protein